MGAACWAPHGGGQQLVEVASPTAFGDTEVGDGDSSAAPSKSISAEQRTASAGRSRDNLHQVAARGETGETLSLAQETTNALSAFSLDSLSRDERLLLGQLQDQVGEVRRHCGAGQAFEAYSGLIELEGQLQAALGKEADEETATPLGSALLQLQAQLRADPMLIKLRSMHPRLQKAVSLLLAPFDDSKGVRLELTEPSLHESFRLSMTIRFAEGAERDKQGPSTQIIMRCDMRNFPAPLDRIVVENCETDLFRKEWLKDCKQITGSPGRPASLYCSAMHVALSPALLPIKVEDVIYRELALCRAASESSQIVPGRGAGVVVIEHRPPDGCAEYEGIPVPPKKKGTIRLRGGMSAYYKSVAEQNPELSDILMVSHLGAPVPQAILPLNLLKRFAADFALNSLRPMKVGLYDQWDGLEYKERAKTTNQDLYQEVARWRSSAESS